MYTRGCWLNKKSGDFTNSNPNDNRILDWINTCRCWWICVCVCVCIIYIYIYTYIYIYRYKYKYKYIYIYRYKYIYIYSWLFPSLVLSDDIALLLQSPCGVSSPHHVVFHLPRDHPHSTTTKNKLWRTSAMVTIIICRPMVREEAAEALWTLAQVRHSWVDSHHSRSRTPHINLHIHSSKYYWTRIGNSPPWTSRL